uniref:Uncharacterized protein n=1 Tax=Anguilla anguilla TaxID=7936 RepID=A0A0E9SKA6_ANGAN
MNPCITRSFLFQLTIKNQKTKICYLILNQKRKRPCFSLFQF